MALGFLYKMEQQRVMKAFHMYGRSVRYPLRDMGLFLEHHSSYLTELTLRCSELTDSEYKTISQCQGLTSLQLYSCAQLTRRGASHLTNLMNLRRLHLTGTRKMRVRSLFNFIQRLPLRIEELNLSYSWFGEEHCKALAARLPNLRYFELWRARISTFHLVQLVELLTSLEDLDTDVILVDDMVVAEFGGHRSLKNIRCSLIDQIKTHLHIKSAAEMVPVQYLRKDEVGPRGGLFYYWLQDLSIRTPTNSPDIAAGMGPYTVRKSSDYDLYDRPVYDTFANI